LSEAQILLGTSGWSYNEWEGKFYEKGERRKLRAYTHIFKTAEIDSTFYRNPSKGVVMGWNRYTPPDFVFTAKLPKLITHTKKLGLKGDVKRDLEEFLDLMLPLRQNGKLACLLIQLPPKYSYNPDNIKTFFEMLDNRFQYAVEFRNVTWLRDETFALLKDHNVAYTIVDEPLLPGEIHVTADFAYFRWHGRGKNIWFDYNYSKEELDAWVPKVQETASKTKKIYGYFNNHFHGYAPENCQYLLEKLGLPSEKPSRGQGAPSKQMGLGDFLNT
jgi:uncharacterized protein YecE (DUF72 family)